MTPGGAAGARLVAHSATGRTAGGGKLLAALLVLLLCGAPAFSGIIELGRAGQKAKGSKTKMAVAGKKHTVGHAPNQDVEDILQDFIDFYNSQGFSASVYNDPNDPNINAMEITDPNGADVEPMSVDEDDENIHPTGTHYSPPLFNPNLLIVATPNAIAGDGNFQIRIAFQGGPVNTYTVTTAGKSLQQVVNEMVNLLNADVSASTRNVSGFGTGAVFDIRPRDCEVFDGVRTDHTDTGISVSGTGIFDEPIPPTAGVIPTLGEWGLITLASLLAGAGVHVLRKRGRNRQV